MGLGDHVICNGLVRQVKENRKSVGLFCHEKYKNNIEYMYRDDEGIKIIPVTNENKVQGILNKAEKEHIKVGFEKLVFYEYNYKTVNKTFDESFYDIAGLDFQLRFNKFFIQRDEKKEQEVLDYLNPNKEKYIYVHDDPDRGFKIDQNKHRSDLRVIKNSFKFNLFQFRTVLEKAEEIHTMQTGMFDFCNSIVLKKPKIFVHKYVRNCSDFMLSKGINEVKFIV